MMNQIPKSRYLKLSGTPYQVGVTLGKTLGHSFALEIDNYILAGPFDNFYRRPLA